MLLSRAAQLVLQEAPLRNAKSASSPEMTPSRANILRLLRRQRRMSVNNIACFLGQTKACASQNTDLLVRSGFVKREPDADDRRLVWVSLTARGGRALKRAERRQRQALSAAIGGLAKLRLPALAKDMRALALALLSHTDTEGCLQCCAYESASCLPSPDGGWRCAFIPRPSRRRTTP